MGMIVTNTIRSRHSEQYPNWQYFWVSHINNGGIQSEYDRGVSETNKCEDAWVLQWRRKTRLFTAFWS